MNTDDDIAAALPKSPPAAPAPRETAIEAALRQFDSGIKAPPARRTTRWWTPLGRPQTGVLVSAALVALVGLPVAWMSLTPETKVQNSARPSAPVAPPNIRNPAAMADTNAPSLPPAIVQPETRTPPPGIVAGNIPSAEAPAAPAMAAPPPPPPPAPPPPPMVIAGNTEAARGRQEAAPAQLARSDEDIEVTGLRAPSRPAAPYALRDVDTSDLIVTAARRSAPKRIARGDWNACTVNDPGQRLGRCRRLVDPAAKGATGLAAARIADGLSQAWQGDMSGAIDAFDQAIDVDPRSAFAYLNRGLARANEGDLDRGIADLDQAVRYAPRAARGYYNRSLLLRQRGDVRRARADEQRAVELDPSYSDVVR